MARKKDDNTIKILALAGVGIGIYLMMKPKPIGGNYQYYPNFPQVPPKPSTPQQIQQWINSIVQTFGTVSSLWQPGGPFYNDPDVPGPQDLNLLETYGNLLP